MAIFEVIKKVKADDNLIWRYPKTNFNTMSQLIVHESQEALFFSNGKALDLFGPGKYTLTTNNIPLLKTFLNIPTVLEVPFSVKYILSIKPKKIVNGGPVVKLNF